MTTLPPDALALPDPDAIRQRIGELRTEAKLLRKLLWAVICIRGREAAIQHLNARGKRQEPAPAGR